MRMTKWAFLAGLLCSGLFTTGNLLAEQTDTAKADSGLFMTAEFPAQRTDTVARFSAVQTDTSEEPEEEEIATVKKDEAPVVETVEYVEPPQPISEQVPIDNSEPGAFSLASLETLAERAPAGMADEFSSNAIVSFDGGGFNASSMGPCCGVCGGGSNCPPNWYTEHGVRNLARSKPRGGVITREWLTSLQPDDPNLAGLVVPNWNRTRADDSATAGDDSLWEWDGFRSVLSKTRLRSMGFNNAPGYTVTLGRYLGRDSANRDQFIEFTYWGLNHWETSKETVGIILSENFPSTVQGVANKQSRVYYPTVENPQNFPADWSLSILSTPPIGGYAGSLLSPFPTIGELDISLNTGEMTPTQQMGSTLDANFNQGLRHSMSYSSTMNNFEFSARLRPRGRADRLVLDPSGKWRRECQPGNYLSFLFGMRATSINEAFQFLSTGPLTIVQYRYPDNEYVDPNDPQADPVTEYVVIGQESVDTRGDYSVRTHNDLFGLQVGVDLIYRKCKWRYGFKAKAGPYVNFADQFSHITAPGFTVPKLYPDDPDEEDVVVQPVDERLRARKNAVSLLAEVGFVGEYRIRPNMNVRAAYDFMWVTGLALAPEQLQFRGFSDVVNTNGHIFSHGMTLTAEWMW